jgi:ABC-type oligopeptide transport system substrate-binding subunit
MPVGTGAFMVTEWVSGDHITMVKNPHYREADKVKIDKTFLQNHSQPGSRHCPNPGR